MASQRRDYRLRIHLDSLGAPQDATVDVTLEIDGETPPYVTGAELNILKGRTESRPWQVRVRDTANALTGNLGADGRPDLLMRLVELQVNEDSAGWATAAVGRLLDLDESDGPDSIRVRVGDERSIERGTDIFDAAFREAAFGQRATTMIYPQGMLVEWRRRGATAGRVAVVKEIDGNYVRLQMTGRPSVRAVRFLEQDTRTGAAIGVASATRGVFQYARLRIDGTDYPIASLSRDRMHTDPLLTFREAAEGESTVVNAWVYMASPPALLTEYDGAYIYAPDSPPTPELRYHFSGHPGAIAEAIYDELGVRYDAAAMAAWKADTRFGTMHFAVDKLWKASDWLERKVYLPTFMSPLVDPTTGAVTPSSLLLAQISDATYAALPTLDASDIETHPTWRHSVDRAITLVRATYASYLPELIPGIVVSPYGPAFEGQPQFREVGLDGLVLVSRIVPIPHDTVDRLGERPVDVDFEGYITAAELAALRAVPFLFDFAPATGESAEGRASAFSKEVFARWGDAPITGEFNGLESSGAVNVPGYFKIDLDTWPNPAASSGAGGRGGVRVVQAVRRSFGPVGFDFELLDAGAANQPLATPTVTVAQNATDPRHAVDVTIADLPAGADCILKFGIGDPPTSWDRTEATDPDDETAALGNGTYTFTQFPSGSDISVKGYAIQAGRFSSEFSTAVVVATDALSAPSALTGTAVGAEILGEFTDTEPDYPRIVMLDGADLGVRLPAGTAAYRWTGLEESTEYEIGVRYVDDYGGQSAAATDTVTTGTSNTLSDVPAAALVQYLTEPEPLVGILPGSRFGFEVRWVSHEFADAVWEISTDSGFATIERDYRFQAGTSRALLLVPTFDVSLRYLRVRYECDGFGDSANLSPTPASGYIAILQRMTPDLPMIISDESVVQKKGDRSTLFVMTPYIEAVSKTIEDLTNLGTGTRFKEAGGSLAPLMRGMQWGYCRDGVTVTFDTPFDSIPLVLLLPMGDFVTFQGDSAEWSTPAGYSATAEQRPVVSADDVTETGFDPYLKLHQSQGATLATQTADWLSTEDLDTGAEASGYITLASAPAYDDYYVARVHYDLTVNLDTSKYALGGTVELDIDVQIDIAADGTYEYFQRQTVSVFIDDAVIAAAGIVSFPITKTGVTTASRWRVRLNAIRNTSNGVIADLRVRGGYDGTARGVTYQTASGTADITTSMTPASSNAMLWVALSGAVASGS